MRAAAGRLLGLLALLCLAWALVVWMAGGLSFSVLGVQVSSNALTRPLLGAALTGVTAIWLRGARATASDGRRVFALVTPAVAAVALATATTAVSLVWGSWTASGPDSFYYASDAALMRSGRLTAPAPLARRAPWPNATESFAPFGYHAAFDGRPQLVPAVAPGLPATMAALQIVGGHAAGFLVTPVAGGVLVWLTFAIGRRVRSPAAGAMAAWLVVTSPAWLFMLMWPMSDVPAAALTAALVACLLGRSTFSALGGGLAAAATVLTRSSGVTIAAAAGLWLVFESVFWRTTGRRWSRIGAFVLGVSPAAVITAWLNTRLYGSPFASGYGPAGQFLSSHYVVPNLAHYARWLAETSPLAVVGLAALAVLWRSLWAAADGRRAMTLLALIALGAVGFYLFWEPYPDWWYLRFLLPAWPAMFVGAAVAFDAVGARGRALRVVVSALVIVAGLAGVLQARARGVFDIGWGERRYVTIARLVAAYTEPTAVILTWQHAGTIRYYAGRETLRFDNLDPDWLDRTIAWLAANGRHPYILVEDWEQPVFESRFRATNTEANLSYPAIVAWQSTRIAGWVWMYDPLRRDAVTVQPGPAFERSQPIAALSAASPWP